MPPTISAGAKQQPESRARLKRCNSSLVIELKQLGWPERKGFITSTWGRNYRCVRVRQFSPSREGRRANPDPNRLLLCRLPREIGSCWRTKEGRNEGTKEGRKGESESVSVTPKKGRPTPTWTQAITIVIRGRTTRYTRACIR